MLNNKWLESVLSQKSDRSWVQWVHLVPEMLMVLAGGTSNMYPVGPIWWSEILLLELTFLYWKLGFHCQVWLEGKEVQSSSKSATVGQSRRFSDTFINFCPTVWSNDCGKARCAKRDTTLCTFSWIGTIQVVGKTFAVNDGAWDFDLGTSLWILWAPYYTHTKL